MHDEGAATASTTTSAATTTALRRSLNEVVGRGTSWTAATTATSAAAAREYTCYGENIVISAVFRSR
jgi:hypothetical protein